MSRRTARRLKRSRLTALTEALEARWLLAAGPYHWPAGGETLVNSYTTHAQTAPAMAMDADGDFVVAWHSNFRTAPASAACTPSGSTPRASRRAASSASTPRRPTHSRIPSVAMDADGDFVIAWENAIVGYYGIVRRRRVRAALQRLGRPAGQ